MCGEDGTDEGEDCASDGGVEGPAQGAVSGFVGRCIVSAVAYGLLAAPASGVEDQTQDKEQACKAEEETGEPPPGFTHGCHCYSCPALGCAICVVGALGLCHATHLI